MRGICRSLLLSASLTLLPSLSFADDPYADYRIPEHYWRSWTANLTAGGVHQLTDGGFSGRSEDGALNGTLTTSLVGGYDSDPRSSAYGLTFLASGTRFQHTQHDEFPPFVSDDNQRDRNASEDVSGFFAFDRYPWSAPLGVTLASNQRASFRQSWSSSAHTSVSPPDEVHAASNTTTGLWRVAVSLSASLDWGRVRDATPVYQVQILEQRLLDEGTIQRALSTGARERLASLYTTEAELAFAHQRPTKFFWRELERLLREDGVLGEGGLDAYSVQRLLEPLTITGAAIARTRGFAVGPQVFVATLQAETSRESVTSTALYQSGTLVSSSETALPRSTDYRRDDFVFSGVSVDYHRPFGPRWQVDGVSRALLSESGEELVFSTGLGATWLVADRWLANAKFTHDLTAPGSGLDRAASFWNVTYGASVSYFLEDSWALQLAAVQRQDHDSSRFHRDESFTLGVTYQFAGFLNAPGLFQSMQLTPPAH